MFKKTLFACLLITTVFALSLVRFDIPENVILKKYTRSESKFLPHNNTNIHYMDQGDGPALILIHGTAASLFTWDAWVKELSADFRVIRLDLPGYALTGPVKDFDYTLESYAQVVDKLAQHLELEKFHLAGNSLGGAVSWRYALLYPEKVDKLILIDPGGYPLDKEPIIFRLANLPVPGNVLKYISPRFIIEGNIKQVYGDDSKITDTLITLYHEMLLREGNREALLYRIQNRPEKTDHNLIKNITQQTLILWGQEDAWLPVEQGEFFKRDIPDSKLITYSGAGHVPMEEIPRRTAADARKFLLNEDDDE